MIAKITQQNFKSANISQTFIIHVVKYEAKLLIIIQNKNEKWLENDVIYERSTIIQLICLGLYRTQRGF